MPIVTTCAAEPEPHRLHCTAGRGEEGRQGRVRRESQRRTMALDLVRGPLAVGSILVDRPKQLGRHSYSPHEEADGT